MLTIIAGSRLARECDVLFALNKCPWRDSISSVISGTAYGADRFGESWAKDNGIEVIRFPADWDLYGRSAGPRRNKEMAENADALIAIWDGVSSGTKDMLERAKKASLRTMVYFYRENRFEHPEFRVGQLTLFGT